MKWREGQYNWEAVLSRNQGKWVCVNLLKNQFDKLKINQILYSLMPFLGTVYFVYENHDANQEIKYTIGKCIFQTLHICLRLFWDIQKSGLKTEIELKMSANKNLKFG